MKLKHTMTQNELIFGWVYILLMQFISAPLFRLLSAVGIRLDLLTANFIFFCLNFAAVIFFCRRFLLKCLRALGKELPKILLWCIAGMVLYWALNIVVSLAISVLSPQFSNANDANVQVMVQQNYPLMLLSTVVLVPIVEETLFRGAVFGSLDKINRVLAYLGSALLFSLVHVISYLISGTLDLPGALLSLLQYLPAGLCLTWVYARTDNIFAPTLIHSSINLLAVLAMR